METAETAPEALYESVSPLLPLGLPFAPTAVSEDWFDWPALPDLFPASFPGVKTSRDSFLVDIDLDRLKERIADYFDAELSDDEITRRYPGHDERRRVNTSTPRRQRNTLLDEAAQERLVHPLRLPALRHPLALLGIGEPSC